MSQLVLESENEYGLKLIQELAKKMAIHSLFVSQKTEQKPSAIPKEIDDAIKFVKNFSQEKSSFGDALIWQTTERQERLLD